MSFLEKLKAQREAAVTENTIAENKPAEEKKTSSPFANILRKRAAAKKEEAKNKDVAAEVKEDVTKEENTESKSEPTLQEKAETIVANILNDGEAEKKEDAASTSTTDETAAVAETKDEAETKEETVEDTKKETETVETPKKRTRKTRKKADTASTAEESPAEKETPTGVSVSEYVNNYDIVGQKVSYDEMVGMVMDYYIDDDWRKTQDQLSKELNDIRIESDMNPGTLKAVIADLMNLNDKVLRIYVEQKQLLDMLTDKDFGVAEAIKARNSVGANTEERKRNAFLSLTKVQYDGKEVNFINLIAATRVRFVFTSKLISMIKQKADACITMSAAIKTEEKLSGGDVAA